MTAPPSPAASEPSGDAIDTYLDELLALLSGEPSVVRRSLAEAEDHLRESAQALEAQGLTPEEAAATAVARFGTARTVARRLRAAHRGRLDRATTVDLVRSSWLLVGIGLVAVGVSGLLAWGLGAAFGQAFVSGDLPDVTYTPARCADLLAAYPHAGSCEVAATEHHFGETVGNRVAAGVLGLVVLAGYRVLARRRPRPVGSRLPRSFVPLVGSAVFGVVAVALLGLGLAQVPFGTQAGGGALVSAGAVSGLVATGFVVVLVRSLDEPERVRA